MPSDCPTDRLTHLARVVEQIRTEPRRRDELVELLDDRDPLYAGRSSGAVAQIRGFVMAAFESTGMPPGAEEYVLEELDNGRHPPAVAAAAAALRGGTPTDRWVPALLQALENVRQHDDVVILTQLEPAWPATAPTTTASDQIRQTLIWLRRHAGSPSPGGDAADGGKCCGAGQLTSAPPHPGGDSKAPLDLILQDQHGGSLLLGELLGDGLTVITFFYTRCDNPSKCSATITRLGELQQEVRRRDLCSATKTAAITYDPEFDIPRRLFTYGFDRGFTFDDHNRMLRVPNGFHRLRDYLQLGVSYGSALPNRHRIELFILDGAGCVLATHQRLTWSPGYLADSIGDMHDQRRSDSHRACNALALP
jgi:protein SCO1/2